MGPIWTSFEGNFLEMVSFVPKAASNNVLICLEGIPNDINVKRFKVLGYKLLDKGNTEEIFDFMLQHPTVSHYYIHHSSEKREGEKFITNLQKLENDNEGNQILPRH